MGEACLWVYASSFPRIHAPVGTLFQGLQSALLAQVKTMDMFCGFCFGILFKSAYAKQYKSYINSECSKCAHDQKLYLHNGIFDLSSICYITIAKNS